MSASRRKFLAASAVSSMFKQRADISGDLKGRHRRFPGGVADFLRVVSLKNSRWENGFPFGLRAADPNELL
jgi:hypothetical protein